MFPMRALHTWFGNFICASPVADSEDFILLWFVDTNQIVIKHNHWNNNSQQYLFTQ